MAIPLNIIHIYIGFVVISLITIELWLRNKTSNQINSTLRNIAMTCGISTLSMFFYGFPVLLTHDRQIITFTKVLADCLQILAIMFLWFIVTRAYLGTVPILKKIVDLAAVIFVVIFSFISFSKNLAPNFQSYVVKNGDSIRLELRGYEPLTIAGAIYSIALIILGFYFYKQLREVKTHAQRIRLGSFSLGFFIGGIAMIAQPIVSVFDKIYLERYLFVLGFIIVVIAGISAMLVNRRSDNLAK